VGNEPKPEKQAKAKKREKKLELSKETIQDLSDADLDQAAGGALKTGGGHCKEQSLAPACAVPTSPCNTITCQSCNLYCG
jgi:hypothetical protein